MPIPTAPDPASATASTSTEVSPEDDVQSSFADQEKERKLKSRCMRLEAKFTHLLAELGKTQGLE